MDYTLVFSLHVLLALKKIYQSHYTDFIKKGTLDALYILIHCLLAIKKVFDRHPSTLLALKMVGQSQLSSLSSSVYVTNSINCNHHKFVTLRFGLPLQN